MSTKIKTYIVDAFTDQPFKGNPAGVCLPKQSLEERTMQAIAKELGLSETAFVVQKAHEDGYTIRYFSPVMEIPLCGHATLASAKLPFARDHERKEIIFHTIEDIELKIRKDGVLIEMSFPVYDTSPQHAPAKLLEALDISEITNSEYNKETKILLLEIEDSNVLRKLKPDVAKLVHSHDSINGVLVTAPSKEATYDFESRYFWPWSGTDEDPVTGGTHTFLAKYWSTRLGKIKMQSFQCSERSGFMEVELVGNDKLLIKSQAQIIFEGQLML